MSAEQPLSTEHDYTMSGDFRFRDVTREPHPTPCPDCRRTYLNGENVTMTAPTLPTGTRVVWSGCCDCWALRTSPVTRVHNHPPYRPICNERTVDGQLRGACLNDDGSDR